VRSFSQNRHFANGRKAISQVGAAAGKLLDHVRDVLRVNHYSVRTEEAYLGWRVNAPSTR